jgi:hypothetical protein
MWMCARSRESAEQSPSIEVADELENYFGELIQRFNDRIALTNLGFSERYIDKKMHVLFHFRLRDSQEFVPGFFKKNMSSFERPKEFSEFFFVELGTESRSVGSIVCPPTYPKIVSSSRCLSMLLSLARWQKYSPAPAALGDPTRVEVGV